MRRNLNSYITVPDKDRRGDNMRPRDTEIAALMRIAFGDPIPATDNAQFISRKEVLKCSRCRQDKRYLEFPKCKAYPWRFDGRGYYCSDCQKLLRLANAVMTIEPADEAYLRSKPNNRRGKKLDLRAATA